MPPSPPTTPRSLSAGGAVPSSLLSFVSYEAAPLFFVSGKAAPLFFVSYDTAPLAFDPYDTAFLSFALPIDHRRLSTSSTPSLSCSGERHLRHHRPLLLTSLGWGSGIGAASASFCLQVHGRHVRQRQTAHQPALLRLLR